MWLASQRFAILKQLNVVAISETKHISSRHGGPTATPAAISAQLRERGVLINPINERQLRAVTHYDVSREQCAEALEAVAGAVAQ